MEPAQVISNPAALTEEFMPSRMCARDGQMQQMAACLAPLSEGGKPRCMLLYGPSGTGKTCMSRYVLSRLAESAGFSSAYVNCWNFETRFKILFSVLQKLGADPSKHRVGTPIDEIIEALSRKAAQKPLVVTLDESDRIADEKAVYDLISVGACLLLIANDETAMYKWDSRIRSRLSSAERIAFPKYRPDELEGILRDRAGLALVPGAITPKEIARIARESNGDARAAIAGLRAAAERAEAEGSAKVTQQMIAEPFGRKEREPELNEHQKIIVDILKSGGAVSPSELLEKSNARAPEPVAERTFRKYMESLVRRGLARAEGDARMRRYSGC